MEAIEMEKHAIDVAEIAHKQIHGPYTVESDARTALVLIERLASVVAALSAKAAK